MPQDETTIGRSARARLGALTVGLLIAAAALVSFVANLGYHNRLPVLPLSDIVGPAKISELRFAQMRNRGQISPALAGRMRAAALRAPLAYEPFLFAATPGFAAQNSVGTPSDARLLREAARRDPRTRAARYLLLRHALAQGRMPEAIVQMAMLNRLSGAKVEPTLVEVGKRVGTVAQIDEVTAALADYPELYAPFVRGFVAGPKPATVIRRLAERLPRHGIDRETIATQLSYRMIGANDYVGARQVWLALGASKYGLVTDPTFTDTKARPPFGWELIGSPTGIAERQPGGGVFIDYYGRKPGPLLRQTLTLPRGDYVATLDYEPQSRLVGGIQLRLSCASAILIDKTFADTPGKRVTLKLPFAVGPNCDGQTLEWLGLLQDRRVGQQIIVHRFDIPAGR